MKKWLFSNNGEITETLTFDEAKTYVEKHEGSELYVWHPSFTHWTPLHEVEDFQQEIVIPTPPVAIPKALLEEYKNKEESMFKTLSRIDNTLGNTRAALSEMDHDIDNYAKVTQKLNTEVRVTLDKIHEQYAALQKNISAVTKDELVY